MNIEATKLELITLLLNTQKASVLEKIKDIFQQESLKDWWEELSEEEHQEIKQGLAEVENGDIKSHKEVMSIFDKWK